MPCTAFSECDNGYPSRHVCNIHTRTPYLRTPCRWKNKSYTNSHKGRVYPSSFSPSFDFRFSKIFQLGKSSTFFIKWYVCKIFLPSGIDFLSSVGLVRMMTNERNKHGDADGVKMDAALTLPFLHVLRRSQAFFSSRTMNLPPKG